MWVVKLGGSLSDSGYLVDWLEQIAHLSARGEAFILVPGGGPFADQVRRVQADWGFDDLTAHRMALLAMEQMAHMLCALHPDLSAVSDAEEIDQSLERGRVPVWLPSRMALADPGIDTDWTVTSDSLALWLAGRLDANGVLLVKSAALPADDVDVISLQRFGLLDQAFDRYLQALDRPAWITHRACTGALAAILSGSTDGALALAG